MKILLFGKTGLLGHALFEVLHREHQLVAPPHEECDVTNFSMVEKAIAKETPELIINATGFTRVDEAEIKKEEAFLLNRDAVENCARWCAKKNLPLVHFSTDYVFDGKNKEGYYEEDTPSPLSVYGKSKAAGEKVIFENLSHFFLIRTAWLYGPGGRNFVDTVIDLAHKNQDVPLTIVNDQTGNPTYTLDLAHALLGLLKTKNYGIYHIVNSGSVTWYEFAKEIFKIIGVPQKIQAITSDALQRPAKRPAYSVLLSRLHPPLRPWSEALAAYLQEKTLIL